MSQREHEWHNLARRPTVGGECRGATPLPTRRAAGANGVCLTSDASIAKRLTPCWPRLPDGGFLILHALSSADQPPLLIRSRKTITTSECEHWWQFYPWPYERSSGTITW